VDIDIYSNLRMKQGLLDSIMSDPKAYARHLETRIDKGI
jgi:hypothetical protein